MLTVDYDSWACGAGDLLLDLGAASAATPSRLPPRRPGGRPRLRLSTSSPRGQDTVPAMATAARSPPADSVGRRVNGDATRLPFADDTFDRIIASRGHGAHRRRRRRARRAHPGAASRAAPWPSPSRPGCPRRSAGRCRRRVPRPLRPRAATCASTPRRSCARSDARRRPRAGGIAHRAHALHSPLLVAASCAVGPTNDDHPLVKAYHRLLVWDIADGAVRHPGHRAAAQPGARQEPRGLRQQAGHPPPAPEHDRLRRGRRRHRRRARVRGGHRAEVGRDAGASRSVPEVPGVLSS